MTRVIEPATEAVLQEVQSAGIEQVDIGRYAALDVRRMAVPAPCRENP